MNMFVAWLESRGFSLEKFAVETGIRYTTVRGWAVDGKKPRAMAQMIIGAKFPDCPLVTQSKAPTGSPADKPRPLRLERGLVRKFSGFPNEDQNEGHAEHEAMSPEERIELTGFILRQYVCGILNLREFPRLDRTAVRLVSRGERGE